MRMVYYPYPMEPFLEPHEVIKSFGLNEGDKVLDFGAGSGFWSVPIAKIIGKKGHVFVLDAKKENLSIIKKRAEREGLENLSYYIAPYECTEMPVNTKVDLILCSNVLSIIKDTNNVFPKIKKLSKKGTKLVIIDWKQAADIGPKKKDRINEEDIILKAGKIGFNFKKLLSAGPYHTGLYFVKEK